MQIGKYVISGTEKVVNFIRKTVMRSTDRKDGKIIDAKSTRKGVVALGALLVVLFVYGIFRNTQEESPINNFQNEITTKLPISQGVGAPNFNKGDLEGFKNNLDEIAKNNVDVSNIPMPDSLSSPGKIPNKFECNELLQGVKNGDILSDTQKNDLNVCMDKNILPMSDDQKSALKQAINDPNLTPEARKLLAAYAENPNSLSEEDRKIVKGLMSSDPEVKALAMGALAPGLSAEEKRKALAALDGALQGDKSSMGTVKTIVEQGKKLAEEAGKKSSSILPSFLGGSSKDSSEKNESNNPFNFSLPKYAGAKELDNEIAKNEEKIARNALEMKETGDKIKNELEKPEDQRQMLEAAYAQMARLSKEQAELKKSNEQKKLQLKTMAQEMNNDLAVIKNGMRSRSTSGIGIFEEVPELNNTEIKDLSEDELRLLKLLEGKEDRFNKKRKNFVLEGNGGDSGKLVVAEFFNKGELQINPAVRLLADLDDDIWCSDKNYSEYTVMARLRQDAVEIDSGNVVLYKGSLIFGKISSINSGIDTATVVFDRAQVGAKIVKIKITTQIRGTIKETRGEQITAAIITEMAASISDGIKEQGDNELDAISNPTIVDKVNNATTGAIGSGLNKLAQVISGDLQNASRIYHARKGTKLVLNP